MCTICLFIYKKAQAPSEQNGSVPMWMNLSGKWPITHWSIVAHPSQVLVTWNIKTPFLFCMKLPCEQSSLGKSCCVVSAEAAQLEAGTAHFWDGSLKWLMSWYWLPAGSSAMSRTRTSGSSLCGLFNSSWSWVLRRQKGEDGLFLRAWNPKQKRSSNIYHGLNRREKIRATLLVEWG